MANEYFRFKQFEVWHDKCAMKVGTDGVLLGAMAPAEGTRRVLDIGTGTGLVALMMAQRCPEAEITAVEIVGEAARQAEENVARSPWSDRIRVVNADFKSFTDGRRFDTIVSNPPYFAESLTSPDRDRTSARHTTELDFMSLIRHAAELLSPDGTLTLIIPTSVVTNIEKIAAAYGLCSVRRVVVVNRPGAAPKRTIDTLAFMPRTREDEVVYMKDKNDNFTDKYCSYVNKFYLKM